MHPVCVPALPPRAHPDTLRRSLRHRGRRATAADRGQPARRQPRQKGQPAQPNKCICLPILDLHGRCAGLRLQAVWHTCAGCRNHSPLLPLPACAPCAFPADRDAGGPAHSSNIALGSKPGSAVQLTVLQLTGHKLQFMSIYYTAIFLLQPLHPSTPAPAGTMPLNNNPRSCKHACTSGGCSLLLHACTQCKVLLKPRATRGHCPCPSSCWPLDW